MFSILNAILFVWFIVLDSDCFKDLEALFLTAVFVTDIQTPSYNQPFQLNKIHTQIKENI